MSGRLLPAALAILAALAAWLTPALQAVVDSGPRSRVGGLASWWVLLVLIAGFAGAVVGRRLPASRLWPLALTAFVCLPWLPGPIPAAFLIWQGPMATLVWILIVLGLLAPVLANRSLPPAITDARTAPWLIAALVAITAAAGARALDEHLPTGDEPHYLVITQSLLLDGDLKIENNHQRGDYMQYLDFEVKPDYLRRGQDGQIYSIHAPGVAVIVAPAFALAGWAGAVLTIVALAAAGAGLIWSIAWRLTGDAGAAWVAAAAFSFTAPGYFHAFTIFPDGPGALFTAVGIWALVRIEQQAEIGPGRLAAVGAALATLPWLHTRFAVIAGLLGLVLVVRLLGRADRIRATLAFLAVPIVSAVAWFAFFWVIWGTPNPAAPYGRDTQTAIAHLWPALPGLLADQQFGLVPNAPIYAAALVGMISLARRHPRLAIEIAVITIPYILVVGSFRMWWAGLSVPARFLTAVLPVLTLPLAVLWTRSDPARRAVILLLLVVSVCLAGARVVVEEGVLLYNIRDGYDLLLDWANRSVSLPLAWPSLHRDIVPDALRDIAIWSAVWLVFTVVGVIAARRTGQAWTWATAALLLTVSVSASFVWGGSADRVTRHTSALELLQHWPGGPRANGWQSQPFALIAPESVPPRLILASSTRGPRRPDPQPLFTAPGVPGGRYAVHVDGARPRGTLSIHAGRTPQIIDTLTLDDRPGGDIGAMVRLPLLVHSLTIEGDESARISAGRLTLVPVIVGNAAGAPDRLARRASRYGPLRVFFLDDNAFMEPPGFWTRGEDTTDVFVDAPEVDATGPPSAMPALRLRAGAVETTVVLTSGEWSQEITLEPGASAEVELPDGHPEGWSLSIETSSGFRPAEHEPGSQDRRNLGVWIEAVETT